MTLDDILLLGDPRLRQVCAPVHQSEVPDLVKNTSEMDQLIILFQQKYGAGRAIAAPQIGLMKRVVCLHIDEPVVMFNPVLSDKSDEMIELWDDCMSFPDLFVRVLRHRRCTLTFQDIQWNQQQWALEDDLSELLQHEVDHLDGILAVDRAIDRHAFRWRGAHYVSQEQ